MSSKTIPKLAAPAASPPASAAIPAQAPKKGKVRKRKTLAEWAKDIRALHWAAIADEQVWSSAGGGWTAMPRAVGLICEVVVKEAHKKMFNASSAAGTTYMTLWMHSQASGIARVESEEDAAFESGYGGERGVTTFRRHLRTLKQMGFIDFVEESRGRVKWVLLFNPYQVVKKLHEEGHLDKQIFRAVSERAMGIGVSHEMEDEEGGAPDAAK
ncbi:hypothetical protein [Rhodoferax sp. GW822-FHT02A01]|uniref:hypothetical protein n=1 Tax=Rhodoferax sp. GW822-FHT02A01 TaxID=3141537 RepID=UPI00315D94D6